MKEGWAIEGDAMRMQLQVIALRLLIPNFIQRLLNSYQGAEALIGFFLYQKPANPLKA